MIKTEFPYHALDAMAETYPYLSQPASFYLLSGDLGMVFYQIHRALHQQETELPPEVELFLERYTSHMHLSPQTYSFAEGGTGFSWVLAYLNNLGILEFDDEDFAELDTFVHQMGMHQFQLGNYDLWYGGIGSALYFWERGGDHPYFAQAIDTLDQTAIKDEQGIRWLYQRRLAFEGKEQADFGFAHGLLSVMVFLARVHQMGIRKEKSMALLEGLFKFLQPAIKLSAEGRNFPSALQYNGDAPGVKFTNRLAFCYGDLGAACAFQLIGNYTGQDRFFELAQQLGHRTLGRQSAEDTGLSFGGMCHGFYGAAYLYAKLHHWTGDKAYQTAMEFWQEEGHAFIERVGGIKNFCGDAAFTESGTIIDHGFINGSSGAALAQLTIDNKMQHAGWDRMLFLS